MRSPSRLQANPQAGFAVAFYAKSVTDHIEKFGHATRTEINRLLLNKLADGLSSDKKLIKINSLLTKLRHYRVIFNAGSDHASRWQMVPRDAEKKQQIAE
jgi:ATP-dependent DNA helicase RecG